MTEWLLLLLGKKCDFQMILVVICQYTPFQNVGDCLPALVVLVIYLSVLYITPFIDGKQCLRKPGQLVMLRITIKQTLQSIDQIAWRLVLAVRQQHSQFYVQPTIFVDRNSSVDIPQNWCGGYSPTSRSVTVCSFICSSQANRKLFCLCQR